MCVSLHVGSQPTSLYTEMVLIPFFGQRRDSLPSKVHRLRIKSPDKICFRPMCGLLYNWMASAAMRPENVALYGKSKLRSSCSKIQRDHFQKWVLVGCQMRWFSSLMEERIPDFSPPFWIADASHRLIRLNCWCGFLTTINTVLCFSGNQILSPKWKGSLSES